MNRDFLIEKLTSVYSNYNYHYICKYVDFCLKRRIEENDVDNLIYHKHHILPKGIPEFKKFHSFSENEWNLARLDPRSHYIAHKILLYALPNSACAINSFGYMAYTIDGKFVNSKDYQLYSILKSNLQKNSVAINKNNKIKFIPKQNLDFYLNDGWDLGYGIKYIHIHKNREIKVLRDTDNVDAYLNDGWALGHGNGIKTIIHKTVNGKTKLKFVDKHDLDAYILDGWNQGRGYAHDLNYTQMYKYDTDFYNAVKVSKDDVESYSREGYVFGVPNKIPVDKKSFIKTINGFKAKLLTYEKYETIMFDNSWEECPYDSYSGKFIQDNYLILSNKNKIENYINFKKHGIYVKDDYLLPLMSSNIWIYNDVIESRIQIDPNNLDEYLNNGWKKGHGFNPQENKLFIHKYCDGKLINKTIDICDSSYYYNNGWKYGTGKSNVKGRKHIHKIDENSENGFISKMVSEDEYDSYITNGWLKGRTPVWHKHKRTRNKKRTLQ